MTSIKCPHCGAENAIPGPAQKRAGCSACLGLFEIPASNPTRRTFNWTAAGAIGTLAGIAIQSEEAIRTHLTRSEARTPVNIAVGDSLKFTDQVVHVSSIPSQQRMGEPVIIAGRADVKATLTVDHPA